MTKHALPTREAMKALILDAVGIEDAIALIHRWQKRTG